MVMTVAEIARRVQGAVEGDGSATVTGLAGLEEARPGDLTFLSNPRYASAVAATKASAVIVAESWTGSCSGALIRVKNPDRAFAMAAALMAPPAPQAEPGVHRTAVVAPGVELGRDVAVGPCCVLEDGVRIGDRTQLSAGCYVGHESVIGKDGRLYPHVSIRERVKIGDRVILHNGVVVGSDGFGYARVGEKWEKIPQVGTVEIGDDVEIGANAAIDRARFGKTVIASGVKIDNLVQVAHNVRIGENTAIAAQAGISGSTQIGRNAQLGGQAGLAGHIAVGDGAIVGAQAGVTKDVAPGTFVSGYPAMPHDKAKEMHAHLMRLPHLKKRVADLEQRLSDLEKPKSASK